MSRKISRNVSSTKLREHGLFFTDALLRLPKPTPWQLDVAREMLGEGYDYYVAMRLGPAKRRLWAREQILLLNMGLVRKFAPQGRLVKRALALGQVEFSDLVQIGSIALLYGCELYDFTLGYRPSTFFSLAIRHRVKNWLCQTLGPVRFPHQVYDRQNKLVKILENNGQTGQHEAASRELAIIDASMTAAWLDKLFDTPDGSGVPLGDLLPAYKWHSSASGKFFELTQEHGDPDSRDERIAEAQIQSLVEDMLDSGLLNQREVEILLLRFGFTDVGELTLSQIGDYFFGCSSERVRQLEAAALNKLRSRTRFTPMLRDFRRNL